MWLALKDTSEIGKVKKKKIHSMIENYVTIAYFQYDGVLLLRSRQNAISVGSINLA